MRILKGVPQGSVLGPVLFNNFINDLAYFINEDSLLNYADDDTIIAHSKNTELEYFLSCESNKIMDWFEVNHMKAHPSKFQNISIGTNKYYECKVKVKGTEINDCNS